MKKIIKLTESDLVRIVKRVINEQPTLKDLGKLPKINDKPEMNTSGAISKKGSIKDISLKTFKNKNDFKEIYEMTKNPNTVWEIISIDGNPVVAGVSKNLEGKYVKSSDFIDLTNGGEVILKPKNYNKGGVMYIQLGRNGSIESGMSWD
jgi:hypothetical protein